MLPDDGNGVAITYGVMRWNDAERRARKHLGLGRSGRKVVWVRDYGAPENGGAMYVAPTEITDQVANALGP
jgi:hypothetical protein